MMIYLIKVVRRVLVKMALIKIEFFRLKNKVEYLSINWYYEPHKSDTIDVLIHR